MFINIVPIQNERSSFNITLSIQFLAIYESSSNHSQVIMQSYALLHNKAYCHQVWCT